MVETNQLSREEEVLLAKIQHAVASAIDVKFRRGAVKHSHDLLPKTPEELDLETLREMIDGLIYFVTRLWKIGNNIPLDRI